MMTEKIILGLILVFFVLAFAVRNIRTYLSTKQSIRGKSLKLTLSLVISTLLYLLVFSRLTILKPEWIFEIDIFTTNIFKYTGYGLVLFGFILGILALITMRDSWRVGIKYEQKTHLVKTGIYRFSRNPYFLSYDILFLGFVLIFPSPILLTLLIALAVTFHKMIIEEEKYLLSKHNQEYLEYKKKVNRYITVK